MRIGLSLPVIGCLLAFTKSGQAVTVPDYEPLSVHVISDEVNPHGLSAAELTQPGDISAALNRPEVGLQLEGPVQETASSCVDAALAALAAQSVDVVIYFAHRGARDCAGSAAQVELTAAFAQLLENGGGIVVFHHGLYEDAQKTEVLQLLGATASGIAWNTTEGQRVFATAPEHFISSHAVSYAGEAALAGALPVPSGTLAYFDNIPDERYPSLNFLEEEGESRTLLFATDSGGVRPLGYALERLGWQGRVVGYQPGEYQPNALDDLDGPNLQVLVNAIVWASGYDPGTDPVGSGGTAGVGGAGGSSSGGQVDSGGSGAATGSGGFPSTGGQSGGAPSGAGAGSEGSTGGSSLGAGGASLSAGGAKGGAAAPGVGCSCRAGPGGSSSWSVASSGLLALAALARRRSRMVRGRVGSVAA